jgi:predicted peroxiredoxin
LTIYDPIGLNIQRDLFKSSKYLLVNLNKIAKPIENPFVLLKDNEDYYNDRMMNYFVFQRLYDSSIKKIVFILPIINRNINILHEKLYHIIDSGAKYYLCETIETRVKTIRKTYLEDDFTLEGLINFLNSKRKEMSNALINDIIEALNKRQFDLAIELISLNYIDPMMNYFIKKNRVKAVKNMKEVNKYLESWSE